MLGPRLWLSILFLAHHSHTATDPPTQKVVGTLEIPEHVRARAAVMPDPPRRHVLGRRPWVCLRVLLAKNMLLTGVLVQHHNLESVLEN